MIAEYCALCEAGVWIIHQRVSAALGASSPESDPIQAFVGVEILMTQFTLMTDWTFVTDLCMTDFLLLAGEAASEMENYPAF